MISFQQICAVHAVAVVLVLQLMINNVKTLIMEQPMSGAMCVLIILQTTVIRIIQIPLLQAKCAVYVVVVLLVLQLMMVVLLILQLMINNVKTLTMEQPMSTAMDVLITQ